MNNDRKMKELARNINYYYKLIEEYEGNKNNKRLDIYPRVYKASYSKMLNRVFEINGMKIQNDYIEELMKSNVIINCNGRITELNNKLEEAFHFKMPQMIDIVEWINNQKLKKIGIVYIISAYLFGDSELLIKGWSATDWVRKIQLRMNRNLGDEFLDDSILILYLIIFEIQSSELMSKECEDFYSDFWKKYFIEEKNFDEKKSDMLSAYFSFMNSEFNSFIEDKKLINAFMEDQKRIEQEFINKKRPKYFEGSVEK